MGTLRALAQGVHSPNDRAKQQPLRSVEQRGARQQRQVQPCQPSAKDAELRYKAK